MIKRTRLLAAALVLASVVFVPQDAQAMGLICRSIESYLSNPDNVTSSSYGDFVGLWQALCER